MGRKKKDQADKSGSQHNESINEQQQTTCTDAQISTNTITMSSGLIGN
ncbi:Retrovirus-related Pol polyprotein, partial [Aphis craccivora]